MRFKFESLLKLTSYDCIKLSMNLPNRINSQKISQIELILPPINPIIGSSSMSNLYACR